jgi:chromosome segregation ATPase
LLVFLGYGEILKRFEKHDRKFVRILKRLREHDKKFAEVLTRLEEHDKKFAEILNEIKQLREDFKRLSMRVEVTIGSMGRRWGEDLERMVLEIFKEALEKGE